VLLPMPEVFGHALRAQRSGFPIHRAVLAVLRPETASPPVAPVIFYDFVPRRWLSRCLMLPSKKKQATAGKTAVKPPALWRRSPRAREKSGRQLRRPV